MHTHEILSSDLSAYVKSQVCHMSLEPQCWWGGAGVLGESRGLLGLLAVSLAP